MLYTILFARCNVYMVFCLLQDLRDMPGGDGNGGSGPHMGQDHTSCQLVSSMLLVTVMYFNMHLQLYVYIYSD